MWQGQRQAEAFVVMGPRLRGDHSGLVRAKDTLRRSFRILREV
jgi:hypothetical protein